MALVGVRAHLKILSSDYVLVHCLLIDVVSNAAAATAASWRAQVAEGCLWRSSSCGL